MTTVPFADRVRVAEAYEQLLVPVVFEQWTHRLADAAEIGKGQRVLDVACGTGVLTRTVAARVGQDGQAAGIDINPAMLAVAARLAPEIVWREGSAEALPWEEESFDAVVSQFGLMLFSSPETALREMMRVLKTGGRMAVAVFGSLESLPAYAAMADVYERLVGPAVGDALRLPFSMGEADRLAALFAAADIETVGITRLEGKAHFPSMRDMVLSDVRGWFPFAQIHLDEPTVEAVIREAGNALDGFRVAGGAVEFPVPVHIVTAVRA